MKKKLKFYWHIHHDILLEPLTEPLKNRIRFIKEEKPKDEIELRLKLIKPVKGDLPKNLVEARQKLNEAGQKYIKARQKLNEAWQKYIEAGQKYDKVRQKCLPQLKALHKKECGCGYDFKRNTIFTKENGLKK